MNIQQNLNQIKQLIFQTTLECKRQPNEVLLLAASKQQNIHAIRTLFNLGITDFGENYVQEAEQKIKALKELPLCWHFIGPIQSNKTKGIARDFHWVHSLSRKKIALLLNRQCATYKKSLNVCLQINLIPEESKSGIPPEEAANLACLVSELPYLKLRGLMTLPPQQKDQQKQYEVFTHLAQLMHSLNQQLKLNMDTLSMGMSQDFIPAIKAGATIIRIGRAIFGERQK
jgi:pyridoxal phosphate enzyme (YggS family)